ncbi:MAG: MFS transporter [Clostridium sp.]|nr:MFS transporter [Clostridium sp.]
MNKKQILKGITIFFTTLIFGFFITIVTFHLFDTLTDNQMKLLFALDVISLLIAGCIAWFVCESKKAKKEKAKELARRHRKRVNDRLQEMSEIEKIISTADFAA